MKIFDTHVHIFPDKLKGKVLPKLAEVCHSPYYSDGTFGDTAEKLGAADCNGFLCLHIATNPKQQDNVNAFALEIQEQNENVYCFGSVHPDNPNAVDMLHKLKAAGIKGVKLHPDYQDFMVDDEKLEPIYAACEELGLIVAFHAGRDPYSPDVVHNPPEKLAKIAEKYPKLIIIAAHMGGMKMADEVEKHLIDKDNVYFDTAFSTYSLSSEEMKKLIRLKGADRVLFATDFPWSTVEAEKELLEGLGLSDEELDKIYYKNAFRLLGIKK